MCAPLRNGLSIRNGIRNGFSPVFMRLVADARIEAFFLDIPESKHSGWIFELFLIRNTRCRALGPSLPRRPRDGAEHRLYGHGFLWW